MACSDYFSLCNFLLAVNAEAFCFPESGIILMVAQYAVMFGFSNDALVTEWWLTRFLQQHERPTDSYGKVMQKTQMQM